jgi:hypothetical protein
LRPASILDQAVDQIGRIAPIFGRELDGSSHRRIEFIPATQSIFTPEDLHLTGPDPRDRPYAGWLYSGVGLIQENGGNRVHDAELLIGVVGPLAGSPQAQEGYPLRRAWIARPEVDRRRADRLDAEVSDSDQSSDRDHPDGHKTLPPLGHPKQSI